MKFIRLIDADDLLMEEALSLYTKSFPLHEQRLPQSQVLALRHPAYHFELLRHEGAFAGLMLYWETADFLYVEHFCTLPALRGQGLGARALDMLAEKGKTIILEIDPPVDALSCRRRNFYLRAGFAENDFTHIHPPYRPEFSGHTLTVLSRPGPLTAAEYTHFFAYLTKVVMSH